MVSALALLIMMVVILLAVLCYSAFTAPRSSEDQPSWYETVCLLEPLRTDIILEVAAHYGKYSTLPSERLTRLMGGRETISRIEANSRIILSLACFAEQWAPGVSCEAIEELRSAGLRLRKQAFLLRLSRMTRLTSFCSPLYIVRIAGIYGGMLRCLATLYKKSHPARHPMLVAAFNLDVLCLTRD